MSTYRIFCALFLGSGLVLKTNAYKIECIYPRNARDPWDVRERIGNWISEFHNPTILDDNGLGSASETPMVIRDGYYWSGCQTTCLHYHDNRVSDPFTKESLFPNPNMLPVFMQNAHSITMCMAQCYAHVANSWSRKTADDFVMYVNESMKLPITNPRTEEGIKNATTLFYDGQRDPLLLLINENDFHPIVMGHVAGFRVMLIADNDGWNANGSMQYSRETDSMVPCTGSCRAYQDTSGYAPKPNPRTYPDLSNDTNKYDCTGLCRHWQPLQEGNKVGTLKRQEHVVPHIGEHARTFLRDVTGNLVDPDYDLRSEALEVIEEVRLTASDNNRKDMIRFFDEKLQVRALIRQNMRDDPYFRPRIPFQDYILFVYGMTIAEYDGVIQAWHEKLRHDYVRPTTVIKHWDSDMLNTFGGDIDHDGPVTIMARDFEALIRVMPHSEFPSGSSCLCTAYMEFVDSYTEFYHNGRRLENITTQTLDNNVLFANMTDVRDTCSESRIWGGMHFKAAIPAGTTICEGLGELAREWIEEMKDSAITYHGVEYGRDDTLPACIP